MGGGTGAGPGEGTAGGGCPPGGPGEVVMGKRRGRGPSAEPPRGSGQGREGEGRGRGVRTNLGSPGPKTLGTPALPPGSPAPLLGHPLS